MNARKRYNLRPKILTLPPSSWREMAGVSKHFFCDINWRKHCMTSPKMAVKEAKEVLRILCPLPSKEFLTLQITQRPRRWKAVVSEYAFHSLINLFCFIVIKCFQICLLFFSCWYPWLNQWSPPEQGSRTCVSASHWEMPLPTLCFRHIWQRSINHICLLARRVKTLWRSALTEARCHCCK